MIGIVNLYEAKNMDMESVTQIFQQVFTEALRQALHELEIKLCAAGRKQIHAADENNVGDRCYHCGELRSLARRKMSFVRVHQLRLAIGEQ